LFPCRQAAPSDRVGESLTASKNREVDAILGGGGSDDAGSAKFRLPSASALSEASATLDDRNDVGAGGKRAVLVPRDGGMCTDPPHHA
jgi:hypothetical protein